MNIKLGILLLVLLSMSSLSGCKTDNQTHGTKPGVESPVGYPAPGTAAPANLTPAYPAPGRNPPPSGGPVRENASLVKAQVISVRPDPNQAGMLLVKVKILTSIPSGELGDFTSEKINQEIELHLVSLDVPNISAGNVISLTVSYHGDELGGGFYGTQISFDS